MDNYEVISTFHKLYSEHKYDEALKICDEYLVRNNEDIEVLELKADVLETLGRTRECAAVCRKIFRLDSDNDYAKSMLNIPVFQKEEAYRVLIAIIIFLLVGLFFPTSETMKCDETLSCSVKQEFFNSVTRTNTIKLTPESQISFRNSYFNLRVGDQYLTKVYYDNKSPFFRYWTNIIGEEETENRLYLEKRKFHNYIQGTQKQYEVSSLADPVMGRLVLIALGMLLLIVLSQIIHIRIKKNIILKSRE